MSTQKQTAAAERLSPEETADLYETTPVDIAIIGGGPAGFSAAVNALNRGRSAVVLSGDYRNSYLYKATELNNVPGLPGVSGKSLLEQYSSHAAEMGAALITGRALIVMPFDFGSKKTGPMPGFQIAYGSRILLARTVVLAVGTSAFTPFPGEDTFLGRGVSYCATCDGMLYRGREVAVIAKSEEAVEEAEYLVRIGCLVHLYVNPADLKRWGMTLPGNTFKSVGHAASYRIDGADFVESLTAGEDTTPVAGVFILRPSIAPEALLPGLALDKNSILTDKQQATNIPGVYAAGDCTGKPLQVAKALGEGLVAALSADAYLTKQTAAQAAFADAYLAKQTAAEAAFAEGAK